MDRSKSKESEKRREDQRRERVRRKKMQARKEEKLVGSLKQQVPSGQMRHEQLHVMVARSTFRSQKCYLRPRGRGTRASGGVRHGDSYNDIITYSPHATAVRGRKRNVE